MDTQQTVAVPSPRELRASIAANRLLLFLVAAELPMHPTTLGMWLNERRPMPPDIAIRIAAAIDRLARRADGSA